MDVLENDLRLDQKDEKSLEQTLQRKPFQEPIFWIGLALIVLSGGIFLATENADGDRFGLAMLNFGCVLLYTIALWVEKRLRWWMFGSRRDEWPTTALLLVLWLISCYALNREIAIFNRSVGWLTAFLVAGSAAAIGWGLRSEMSERFRAVWAFSLAAFSVLMGYLAIITMPTAVVGTLVAWFFGISLHAWVPTAFLVYLVLMLRVELREGSIGIKRAIWAGIAGPLLIAFSFVSLYFFKSRELSNIFFDEKIAAETALPAWVRAAQRLPADAWTERLLKGEEFYQTPANDLFDFGGSRWGGETRLHDPLIFLAKTIAPKVQIDWSDRQKILKSVYGGRHDQQERLWSGFDLIVPSMATRVEIDAPNRLAYTEKTLLIHNSSSWTNDQKEAIFTFRLPEGAVVSSLSLWVNGEERPGWLDAKSKVDSAYRTIVGVQRRDPALVTWQEGSTVTLRVFPCTPTEQRKVKIGVTAPLRASGDGLFYDNIAWDGPPPKGCRERADVFLKSSEIARAPSFFAEKAAENNEKRLFFEGSMRGEWSLELKKAPLSATPFSLNGRAFRIEAAVPALENFRPSAVYLDLNSTWERAEFERLAGQAFSKNWPLRFWLGGSTLVEARSLDEARGFFNQLSPLQFSLFPFQKIPDPATALVITKSDRPTPNLRDLDGSGFEKEVKKWTAMLPADGASIRPIRCFSLAENGLSSWLASLAEASVFQIERGSVGEIEQLLKSEQFAQLIDNQQVASIPASKTKIVEVAEKAVDGAANNDLGSEKGSPHLARLFAYRSILRQIGPRLFDKKYEPAPLVALAREAHIVTPVSSMVVLETDEDYARFGITPPPVGSLGNSELPAQIADQKSVPLPDPSALEKAANNSSGSVPEPSEWAMIFLLGFLMFFLWRRRF